MGFSRYGLGPDSPGPLLVRQQNMNFLNNHLQNIEQKHTYTIFNITSFFLSSLIELVPHSTQNMQVRSRTSMCIDCGLGGGDIVAGRFCLGVAGIVVALLGGVLGRSILGINV